MIGRGVWRACYVSQLGRPLLAAITSDGRRIVEHEVLPSEAEETVAAYLWTVLDAEDPVAVEVQTAA